jgi:uncharacterized protein (TIGR03000 family)
MGLAAITGLGLLPVGGPARADTQGWPLAGSWDTHGGIGRSSFRSYPSNYYPTYQTMVPQSWSYYSPVSPRNYYFDPTIGAYYGSTGAEDYYDSSGKRPIRVNLRVPSDAKIWFDGSQTNQTGTIRSFVSPPVDVGPEYAYQIQVQWKQDGKDIAQTRQINVHGGDVINLTVGSPAERNE